MRNCWNFLLREKLFFVSMRWMRLHRSYVGRFFSVLLLSVILQAWIPSWCEMFVYREMTSNDTINVIWIRCFSGRWWDGDRIGNDASSDVNPGVYGDVTGDNENGVLCSVANVVFFSGDGDKLDSRNVNSWTVELTPESYSGMTTHWTSTLDSYRSDLYNKNY